MAGRNELEKHRENFAGKASWRLQRKLVLPLWADKNTIANYHKYSGCLRWSHRVRQECASVQCFRLARNLARVTIPRRYREQNTRLPLLAPCRNRRNNGGCGIGFCSFLVSGSGPFQGRSCFPRAPHCKFQWSSIRVSGTTDAKAQNGGNIVHSPHRFSTTGHDEELALSELLHRAAQETGLHVHVRPSDRFDKSCRLDELAESVWFCHSAICILRGEIPLSNAPPVRLAA